MEAPSRMRYMYVGNTNGMAHDWRYIWMLPAGLALAVAMIFAFGFRDRRLPAIKERTT